MKAAREELLKSAKDERKKETTGDPNMDKVRNDTAARILHLIGQDTLPTPRAGTRENPDELDIYENELQSLAQETRDKLKTLTKIQDAIEKAGEEENQVREELNHIIIESEKEHGSLADRLVTLDEQYQVLADLELELMDIRRRGNIIAHEKTVKIANTETLSQDTIESLRKELEERKDDLSTAFKAAQPIRSDINQLCYKLETAEKFIEVVNDIYASCLKDKSIGK